MKKSEKDKIIAALYTAKNIYCNPKKPLKGGAGFYQPIYLDHRNLLSFPKERDLIFGAFKKLFARKRFDVIAGNETAGIAFAAFLSQLLICPMVYIRKKPKTGGTQRQIEGFIKPDQRALVIDDMAVTGGNIKQAVIVLRNFGVKIEDAAVISVVKEDIIKNQFSSLKINFHFLVTFQEIVDYGIEHEKFSQEETTVIKEYLSDPINWGRKKGFV